jgi:hypothetical protein
VGLPYVLSSDLVSAYPAKSLSIAEYVDGQIPLLAMTQNAQTGVSYSFVLTDFTKLVTTSNAGAVAVTLPLESSVAWPAGTQLRILNEGAGTVTVAGDVGVTINGTPLTLAQYKGANLIKTGTDTWTFIPFASGVGAAVYSDANTGTYTGFAYKTFSASGTLTVTTAGFADIVVQRAVAARPVRQLRRWRWRRGGALIVTNAYLPVGTLTCTVGAGGVGGAAMTGVDTTGQSSRLGDYFSPVVVAAARIKIFPEAISASGGGGSGGTATLTGGTGTPDIGNNGGNGAVTAFGSTTAGGGGGGAGAVGSAAPPTTAAPGALGRPRLSQARPLRVRMSL